MKKIVALSIFVFLLVGNPIFSFTEENIAPRTITIVIQKGNTLWGIASNFLNDPFLWHELLKYNDIEDPNLIYTGNKLTIPISDKQAAEKALKEWKKYLIDEGKSNQEIEDALNSARNALKSGDYGLAHGLASKQIEKITGVKATKERSVRIQVLKGRVMVRRFGELNWINAEINMKLESGDAVRTHSDSYVEIALGDQNTLNIKPNAFIVIGDLTEDKASNTQRSSVKILNSDVSATVQKGTGTYKSELEIQTPSATAEIQEANMAIRVNPDKTSEFRVFSGSAQINTEKEELELTEDKAARVDEQSDISLEDLPPSPSLTAPAHQKVIYFTDIWNTKVTLDWKSVSQAQSYHLEVARFHSFSDIIKNITDLGTTQYTVSDLHEGIYYWRVSCMDSEGLESPPSDYRIFLVSYSPEPETTGTKEEPPFLYVGEPQVRKGEIHYNTIYVAGDTEPGSQVLINGTPVTVDPRGGFGLELKNRLPGRNLISIKSIGSNGAIAFQQKHVTITY